MSDSLWPHELHHARPPCPSPTPGVHPNPCPLSQWCHPTISSSVIPFSSCPQSFPASGSFQMSQLFESGGQSIGVSASASVFPTNIQDWFPLGWRWWNSSWAMLLMVTLICSSFFFSFEVLRVRSCVFWLIIHLLWRNIYEDSSSIYLFVVLYYLLFYKVC